MPARSYLSQVELPVTLGLGDTDQVERVIITWPDGRDQVLADLEINCEHEIYEP